MFSKTANMWDSNCCCLWSAQFSYCILWEFSWSPWDGICRTEGRVMCGKFNEIKRREKLDGEICNRWDVRSSLWKPLQINLSLQFINLHELNFPSVCLGVDRKEPFFYWNSWIHWWNILFIHHFTLYF